ncbi:hypothetical protein Tco_0360393 [Tanacetum coccineum]
MVLLSLWQLVKGSLKDNGLEMREWLLTDEVTWMAFEERGDGIVITKRRRQDFQGDDVIDLTTSSGCSRLKTALEDSIW